LLREDQSVSVRNPELIDVLRKVQEAPDKLSDQTPKDLSTDSHKLIREKQPKKRVAAYDAILSALSDVGDVARRLVETQKVGNTRLLAAIACSCTVGLAVDLRPMVQMKTMTFILCTPLSFQRRTQTQCRSRTSR